MRRANRLVRATPANGRRRPGRKLSGANIRRHFLRDRLRLLQLLRVALGHLDLVVLQVVKDQPNRIPLKDLSCRERIQTELQILFGQRFLLGPTGFVVHDFHIVQPERN